MTSALGFLDLFGRCVLVANLAETFRVDTERAQIPFTRCAMCFDGSGCSACSANYGECSAKEALADGSGEDRHRLCLLSLFYKTKMDLISDFYNGDKVSAAMQEMRAGTMRLRPAGSAPSQG